MASSRPLSEQETIIRWDRSSDMAQLYTAHAAQARKWERRGYAVETLPGGWQTLAPIKAITVRKAPHLRKPRGGAGHTLAAVFQREADTGKGEGAATLPPVPF